jgi:hypothetical protein
MNARVVWKQNGTRIISEFGPAYWNGGTCEWDGQVLIYNELPAHLQVENGKVWYRSRYREDFSELCDMENVAAVFDESGKRIYP